MNSPRLYRSTSDRMIAGVCGGLGKYFNVDATIVRAIFLLLLFMGGGGIPLYLVLWIIIPDEQRLDASLNEVMRANTQELAQSARDFGQSMREAVGPSSGEAVQPASRNGPVIFAVVLIFLGVWFLLQNLLHIDLGQLWPVILIIIGLALLLPAWRKPHA
ncbi:MAG TPA: PspC domain-containing protein [Anaerolineae bacterium]|nr:PspC domain-containing protein [Anaerolineae bacterium]